jgi:hypothetical protein
MIRQIVSITCDWCEETEQLDMPVHEAIADRREAGWIMLDGRDFCCEVCREKDRSHRLPRE